MGSDAGLFEGGFEMNIEIDGNKTLKISKKNLLFIRLGLKLIEKSVQLNDDEKKSIKLMITNINILLEG